MAASTLEREAETEEESGGGRKKLLVVGVLVIVLAAGGWWFLLRGGETEPKPGEVATLEPVQVNLADGHFLRIGIALQLTEGAHEVDGAKALDATISMFSGRSPKELAAGRTRERLKGLLLKKLVDHYEHDVMDLYFTEFVMQ
ncbi:MAG TPA: flagellar basal body-associated FliL family protein [Nocardioides sp.]|nr:flagellar basal body-associated FliL family protein [Nocardioides sp.]